MKLLLFFALLTAAPGLPKLFRETYSFLPAQSGAITPDGTGVYVCRTEVANAEYNEFLFYMKRDAPETVASLLPDTAQWKNPKYCSLCEPFAVHYHTHSAYLPYPVVNVSPEAAEAYCAWLTEFNNSRGLFANSEFEVVYRLPRRDEWMLAARGGKADARYAWESARKASKDKAPANYLLESDAAASITSASDLTVTAPAISYVPNGYNLYNMSGNVAELLANGEGVAGGSWRDPQSATAIDAIEPYDGPAPTVGFRVVAEVRKRQ